MRAQLELVVQNICGYQNMHRSFNVLTVYTMCSEDTSGPFGSKLGG
jgi:hypothetical protein